MRDIEELREAIRQFERYQESGWSKSEVPNSACLIRALDALRDNNQLRAENQRRTGDNFAYKTYRLLQHVEVDKNGCWLWTLNKHGEGYGEIFIDGKRYKVNRLAYELFCGEIPEGLWVLHHCDVRNCIRPSHLYVGTVHDNNRDMVVRGRQVWGEKCASAKLTKEDVLEIRRLLSEGQSQRNIAKLFNVSQKAINYINTGRNWKALEVSADD